MLAAGWILILPSDAKGGGVHSGPVPKVSVAPSSPASPVASLSPSASGSAPGDENTVVLLAGVGTAFLLLIAAVAVLQGGRRASGPLTPVRSVGASPRLRSRVGYLSGAALTDTVVPAADLQWRPDSAAPVGSGPGEPRSVPHGRWPPAAQPGPAVHSGPPARFAAPDRPADGDGPPPGGSRPRDEGSGIRPSGVRPGDGRPDGQGWQTDGEDDRPEQEQPPAPPIVERQAESPAAAGSSGQSSSGQPIRPVATDELVTELVADGGRVSVSLVGAAGDGPGVAYGWGAAGQALPVAALPVVLGDVNGHGLHLDLGRCPDVLTVAGALPDCEKYTLRLVHQMLTNGRGVTVVGETLFADALPAGCRRVATMADLTGPDSPGIVVSGRLSGADVAAARLSLASGGPTPVIIGEVPQSRWTLHVGPA